MGSTVHPTLNTNIPMLRLLLVLPVIQALTVIDLPGDWSQILRHKFTPDKPWDPKKLSICMRFYPHKAEIEKSRKQRLCKKCLNVRQKLGTRNVFKNLEKLSLRGRYSSNRSIFSPTSNWGVHFLPGTFPEVFTPTPPFKCKTYHIWPTLKLC